MSDLVERDDPICARCGCYRSAHGEGERCEPVGWTFTTDRQYADRIEALKSENANMLAHLQAAAGWSDEDMHNPGIM